ncbi:MaoC family dehydratase N-terminal domain-containing protein [Oceanobacillus salinisoli]|uniref:MaoC family dehydratase N-terminal domain-containing protein n=1 Tax=Oceanobacillus salinisoli TaxID=2678611 RepID=UPI0012E322D9|nr:MaoC family dehydratase N-terminal domain-containing protein [Oceanobacillus salinisoli]
MYKHMIGKQSNKVKNTVEKGMVKRFVESIGDPHPIYTNEEVGKKSRYGKNIAPPTYPRVFDYGVIEGLILPEKGLIHGEQNYHYERPLFIGEEISCYSEVKNYVEKSGTNGRMGFLEIVNYGEDQEGNMIFSEKMVTIITETVRKAMCYE